MNFVTYNVWKTSRTHTHTFGWSAKVGQERAWDSAFFQKVEMADELATELRIEIKMKREYAELEKQRILEDKMIKVTELHKRARFASP